MNQETKALLEKAISLGKQLEEMKKLYTEMDGVIHLLLKMGFTTHKLNDFNITLKDNFAEKNVVFRPAGVRRFELKIDKV